MLETKKTQNLYQVTQKVLFYRPADKKFLFAKDSNVDGKFYKDYGPWDVIGGRPDENENVDSALDREVREEAGEDICYEVDSVLGRAEMVYGWGNVMAIGFLAIYKDGEVRLSDEHSEFKWCTADEVEKDEEIKPWLKQFVKTATERLKEREYLNDLKRCQADFENYKKRLATQQKELGGYLIERLVMDLVPVMDNFRSATEHVPEAERGSPWVTGIQYIEKQLEKVLTENGVETITAQVGDAFDPKIHEAVSGEATNDESGITNHTEGKEVIVKVLQNGYKIGERIIRPVKVVINS